MRGGLFLFSFFFILSSPTRSFSMREGVHVCASSSLWTQRMALYRFSDYFSEKQVRTMYPFFWGRKEEETKSHLFLTKCAHSSLPWALSLFLEEIRGFPGVTPPQVPAFCDSSSNFVTSSHSFCVHYAHDPLHPGTSKFCARC